MTEAPSFANPAALAELGIEVVKKEEKTDMAYKRPVSVLVVIYAEDTKRVLMCSGATIRISGSRLPAAGRGEHRRPPRVK